MKNYSLLFSLLLFTACAPVAYKDYQESKEKAMREIDLAVEQTRPYWEVYHDTDDGSVSLLYSFQIDATDIPREQAVKRMKQLATNWGEPVFSAEKKLYTSWMLTTRDFKKGADINGFYREMSLVLDNKVREGRDSNRGCPCIQTRVNGTMYLVYDSREKKMKFSFKAKDYTQGSVSSVRAGMTVEKSMPVLSHYPFTSNQHDDCNSAADCKINYGYSLAQTYTLLGELTLFYQAYVKDPKAAATQFAVQSVID